MGRKMPAHREGGNRRSQDGSGSGGAAQPRGRGAGEHLGRCLRQGAYRRRRELRRSGRPLPPRHPDHRPRPRRLPDRDPAPGHLRGAHHRLARRAHHRLAARGAGPRRTAHHPGPTRARAPPLLRAGAPVVPLSARRFRGLEHFDDGVGGDACGGHDLAAGGPGGPHERDGPRVLVDDERSERAGLERVARLGGVVVAQQAGAGALERGEAAEVIGEHVTDFVGSCAAD